MVLNANFLYVIAAFLPNQTFISFSFLSIELNLQFWGSSFHIVDVEVEDIEQTFNLYMQKVRMFSWIFNSEVE